jgi:hypothetical protein
MATARDGDPRGAAGHADGVGGEARLPCCEIALPLERMTQ